MRLRAKPYTWYRRWVASILALCTIQQHEPWRIIQSAVVPSGVCVDASASKARQCSFVLSRAQTRLPHDDVLDEEEALSSELHKHHRQRSRRRQEEKEEENDEHVDKENSNEEEVRKETEENVGLRQGRRYVREESFSFEFPSGAILS